MIDMFLKFGELNKEPIFSDKEGTETLHVWLLIISFLCIPIMLLVRPIHAVVTGNISHKDEKVHNELTNSNQIGKKNDKYYEFKDEEDDEVLKSPKEEVKSHNGANEMSSILRSRTIQAIENQETQVEALNQLKKVLKVQSHGHSLEELFVHSLIETIEFVLGTISNTASYLRLWALSLAHSQLADVFYEKTLVMGLEMNSSVVLFISQQLFWGATLGVLMSMDSMECFLHTLRLHWVEFQNKFYKGTGTKFTPLSFKSIVNTDN